jgi:O-antigen ligase
LLLFPLVLISTGEKIRKNVMLLLKIFAISTFIFLVIAVGYAIYRSLSIQEGRWIFNPHPANENWLNYFYASKFAIFQHPSYLSMFALFSGFIALESFLNISESLLSRFLWLLMSIVFLISIYLLSSRAAILTVFLTIPFYFIYKYFTGGIKKRGAIAFVISIFFLSVLFISNPRFNILIKNDVNNDLINKTQKESRISIWKSALYLIEDNLLLGVGTGNIQDELNKIYFNSENSNLIKVKDLNAHNQFIEIAAENGLVGLILFLAIFVMMTTIAISERNILYLLFVTIVFISFLFETMLNRLAGLSFFAFFSFLLVHLNDFKNIKTK